MKSSFLKVIIKSLSLSVDVGPSDTICWQHFLHMVDETLSLQEEQSRITDRILSLSGAEYENSLTFQEQVTEERLRAQKDQIDSILSIIPCMVLWTDMDLHYQGSNQAYLDFLVNFGAELHFEGSNNICDELLEKLKMAQDCQDLDVITEYHTVIDNLDYFWHLIIRKNDFGYFLVGIDLTQSYRSQKELELQRGKTVSSSRLAALGEMAGGVAHEINNPLAVIMGSSEALLKLIAREEIDRLTVQKRTQKISDMASRISNIVKGLRSFSRDGSQDPFVPTRAIEIVEETVALCKEQLMNNGVDLEIEEFDHELTLDCRATQIGQILMNLLSNAKDAVSKEETKTVKLVVTDLDDQVQFSVIDSGPGIPPEIRNKILQPFFTTKDVGKGTGLGLSVSKGIADAHKGSLCLNETSPQTRFDLTLPKYQTSNQSSEAA